MGEVTKLRLLESDEPAPAQSEAALVEQAIEALRAVEDGCPSIPRFVIRAVESQRELLEMWTERVR
jgi:hypothetical protein